MERYYYTTPSPLRVTLVPPRDSQMTAKSGEIRIGIGGWTFEPWRGAFYPKIAPQAANREKMPQTLAF